MAAPLKIARVQISKRKVRGWPVFSVTSVSVNGGFFDKCEYSNSREAVDAAKRRAACHNVTVDRKDY